MAIYYVNKSSAHKEICATDYLHKDFKYLGCLSTIFDRNPPLIQDVSKMSIQNLRGKYIA